MENEELEYINGQSDLEYLEEMALSSDFADIDDISNNVTYLKALLLELQKYKKLEKEIGCPLDVKSKLYEGANIYYKTRLNKVGWGKVISIDEIGMTISCSYISLFVYWRDYKNTWWLKADRSE